MNEQGVRTTSPTQQGSPSNLSEPHFDDIAIAIAQPVEPLAENKSTWMRGLGIFRKHVSTRALLVILAAAVGFASVTFGLAGVHRFSTEEQATIASPEQSAPIKIVEITKSNSERDSSSRPTVRISRPRISGESKPVARKVGEIR